MARILQIDSSSRSNTSVTRQLTNLFTQQWQKAHPDDVVTKLDLLEQALPFVSELSIAASYTPAEARTPEMRAAIEGLAHYADQFAASDVFVIGAPMYNFTVPAALKAYIDLIVVPGKTFAYENGMPKPILKNKRVYVMTASGGDYGSPQMMSMNFVEPYLVKLFAFLGITDVQFVAVRGHNEEQIAAGMQAATKEIDNLIKAKALVS